MNSSSSGEYLIFFVFYAYVKLKKRKEKKTKFNLPSCLRSNSEPTLDIINKTLFLTRYELSDANP
jgi:hypothetical protein